MPEAVFTFARLGDDKYIDREDRDIIVTDFVARTVTVLNFVGGNAHGGQMTEKDVLVRVGFWGEEDRHEEDVAVKLLCGDNQTRQDNRKYIKSELEGQLGDDPLLKGVASLETVYQDNDFSLLKK